MKVSIVPSVLCVWGNMRLLGKIQSILHYSFYFSQFHTEMYSKCILRRAAPAVLKCQAIVTLILIIIIMIIREGEVQKKNRQQQSYWTWQGCLCSYTTQKEEWSICFEWGRWVWVLLLPRIDSISKSLLAINFHSHSSYHYNHLLLLLSLFFWNLLVNLILRFMEITLFVFLSKVAIVSVFLKHVEWRNQTMYCWWGHSRVYWSRNKQ